MKSGLTLSALVLLGIFLFANTSALHAVPPPAIYRIAGVVVDSVNGEPLEGAMITIASVTTTPEEQPTFLTSSNGRFLFANLTAGKYQLLASHRGYATQALHQH